MRTEISEATGITNPEGGSVGIFHVFRFVLSYKHNLSHFKIPFIHIFDFGL
jgi:hypothetical protein